MKAATYNPATLDRIRRGACAADLGWDESFYSSVCRKHGIERMPSPGVTVAAPSRLPPVDDPIVAAPGEAIFDAKRRELHAGEVVVSFKVRHAEILLVLVKRKGRVGGADIARAMNINRQNLVGFICTTRGKLNSVEFDIAGHKGNVGGYELVDLSGRNRVIKIVGRC